MLMFSMRRFLCPTWITVMMMIVFVQMHGYRCCIETERKGLMDLKAYLNHSDEFSSDWPNDMNSDCCQWETVNCDLKSGSVIGLFLQYAYNVAPLNLSLFHPFGELHTLNLSSFLCTHWFDDIHGYKSLGRLENLEVLEFSSSMVNSSILPFLNAASSLKTLVLNGNSIEGTFPMKDLKDLRKLELLDLSRNLFSGPLPDEGLAYLHKLEALDLSDNSFSGSLDKQGICQLKNLRELDLSRNELVGGLPLCLGSLTELQVLDISSNRLNGTIPSFISNLTSLEYLSLSDNMFEGSSSLDMIANLSKLKVFKLSSRSNLLAIETEISWQPRFQLNAIELQYCHLRSVPSFLQQQKSLRLVNLSNNKMNGAFPFWFLENNKELKVLLLQNNSFTIFQLPGLVHSLKVLDVSTNEFDGELPENIGNTFSNLRHLNLSKNGFQGNLPSSFNEMEMLEFLDISRNNLSGSLQREFLMGCYSLRILKLSHNRFTGQIFTEPANLTSLGILIANDNKFDGISVGLLHSKDLAVLDLSNNYLRGAVPSWLGGFDFTFLLVSNNLLEGEIPSTLFNGSSHLDRSLLINEPSTTLVDLSRNKFSGNLPQHFSSVAMLFLNDNEFSGLIPGTLLESSMVLDLRNNNLSGIMIPRFPERISIEYLLLRGNRLTGHILKDLCGLRTINILDLANNRLNGSIPSCLNNLSFGRPLDLQVQNYGYTVSISTYIYDDMESYYGSFDLQPEFEPDYYSVLKFIVEFASKSRYDSYTETSFSFMFGLDLSNNELSGAIPKELGDLQRIRSLNLSHNSLSGIIPQSFSNLTDIESIDLSSNMLHGQIPQNLTKLDYLVTFNVSYNNLSGSIPSQGKFLTLSETNYIGNPLLCGSPVNRSCDTNVPPEPDHQGQDDETAIDLETFYWSLGATYGVTWMTFLVFLCFDSPLRRAWFRLVDAFISSFKCV